MQMVAKIRENQNGNQTLKSLFASQFLGKFSDSELEALKKSIDKQLEKGKQQRVSSHISYLEEMGYQVIKK